MDDYSYTPISSNISDPHKQAEDSYHATAFQGVPYYAQTLNKDVGSQSNLMGPSNPEDPESTALAQRAKNLYDSNVNQVYQQAVPRAQTALAGLQKEDIANHAAIYSNEQNRATINYKQAAFQRGAAIYKENLTRQLYQSLFGGVAQVGGAALAAATGSGGGGGISDIGKIGAGLGSLFGGGGSGKNGYWSGQMNGPGDLGSEFAPGDPGWSVTGSPQPSDPGWGSLGNSYEF